MRLARTASICLALALICLVSMGRLYASVVTVDVVGKSATSDISSLEAKGLKIDGDQIGVLVRNLTLDPQKFTLKISGLKDQDYDIYLNDTFKWTKPSKDFEAGVEFTVDGRVADSAMIKCLEAVIEPIKKASKKMNTSSNEEAKRIYYTLSQASGWAMAGTQRDRAWRSVSIILAPTGRMVKRMYWQTRDGDIETAQAVTRACWLLQQARDRMFHVIKDPALRNEAVVAMTPVEFTAVYSTVNGKPHINAKVLNNCNLPLSGNISMALPPRWKTTAKKLTIGSLKSGQTFSISFDLVPPSKSAVAPDKVPMAANLTVVQDSFTAGLKLTATAQAEAK